MATTTILCIIDGLGISDKTSGNAFHHAKTPTLDRLIAKYPYAEVEASEEYVGLPAGQMGNSEVGHFTIGAGQVIRQGLAKINESKLSENQEILNIIALKPSKVHLVGLASDGGVHAHISHMADIAKVFDDAGIELNIHAITDGRDSAPRAALKYLKSLEQYNIKTICGRFYAMDRDTRYERTKSAYDCIAEGDAPKFSNYTEVLDEHYKGEKSDEFIKPHAAADFSGIKDGEVVLFTNFRADRARQLSAAFCLPEFDGFKRKQIEVDFYGMMSYSDQLYSYMKILFSKAIAQDTLGDFFANKGLRQLRVAETEKYAHVTFFFNGGREKELEGEDRILVPSPKVKTYDFAPKMSAKGVTDAVLTALSESKYDFICMNYANADMVGHTGDFDAAVIAVETVDQELTRIVEMVEQDDSLQLLITADHGNVEAMLSADQKPKTSHTLNPVPLIYLGKNDINLQGIKGLADIKGLIEQLV